jgi:Protein of unknown function (DUF1549)/Protein of unknown function (DUF1553)
MTNGVGVRAAEILSSESRGAANAEAWTLFSFLIRHSSFVIGFFAVFCAPTLSAQPLAFRTQILPILTKAGCNAGACHGAATGQGGFKLSLLGYDPEEDYDRITRELSGRRLDLDTPAESLFLRKPTRQLEHEGGRRIARDTAAYQTLLRWIDAGAPYGPRELLVKEIRVAPSDNLIGTTNQTRALRVTAFLSDGSQQEVSDLALYTSNDDAIAEVDKNGTVTTRGCGSTSIMVRYSGQVTAARFAVPFGETGFPGTEFPSYNFIDDRVRTELSRLRLPSSPLSRDAEFLRRVYLDLIGRLPSTNEARDFLSQAGSSAKRQRVIEELLSREEFVDLWTMRLADLLLNNGNRVYHLWMREQVARNIPFDHVARALLTATGDLRSVGPAHFFTLADDPRDLAEHVGRIFLGTQIGCARCHAHPVDRWTQEDYYRFAAYFARVTRDHDTIKVGTRGEVVYPKTGQPLAPKPLGAQVRVPAPAEDPRIELAAWLSAPDNALFARAFVNRVWKHLLGRGLVEPVDDLRPTNPPTHPALLDALAADFASNHYDLRRLIHTIVSSRTYQLTSRTRGLNRLDDRCYSHALLKELPAPVFLDAVAKVTGVPDQFESYPEGTHAVQLIGLTPSYALDVLGRCPRKRTCDSPGRAGGGLAKALHLINGPTINDKLRGLATERLAHNLSNRELIEDLYLRALTRPPEQEELAEWEGLLSRADNKVDALEDLLWTLLNSREFAFNH